MKKITTVLLVITVFTFGTFTNNAFAQQDPPRIFVDSIGERPEITLFPNPTPHNEITVNSNFEVKHLSLYNVLGLKIKDIAIDKESSLSTKIDLTELNNGVYMIYGQTNRFEFTKRFVKR